MKKQKIQCVIIDRDVEVTASLDAALHDSDVLLDMETVTAVQQIVPALGKKPHLLFCPQSRNGEGNKTLLDALQRYSPDTLLVWVTRDEWQGLTTWLSGVESCTLPLNDVDYFRQYVDFLLHYSGIKQEFRQCKHLLGVAELRCHWLVDYSWEAIAYVSQGMHLYANNAYVTLFGFESLAEVRSMPVAHLVDTAERKVFETMSKAADDGNKPSNRLLTTLRCLSGERLRAEIRFIPAVLKGKRCTQLHVRPLERHVRVNPELHREDNPWEKTEQRLQAMPEPGMPVAAQIAPLQVQQAEIKAALTPSGMKMVFTQTMRLRQRLPELFVAEPVFQQQDGQMVTHDALLKQLGQGDGRFRLDYWSVGQVALKLSAENAKPSGYLIFVSVGEAIFNNELRLKRLLEVLNASPDAACQIVLGLQYQVCSTHVRQLPGVVRQLKATGVHLAIDGVNDDELAVKLVQAVKPAFVRLSAALSERLARSTEAARQLHKLVHRLGETSRVIVGGVNEAAALNLVYATAATYVEGEITQQK